MSGFAKVVIDDNELNKIIKKYKKIKKYMKTNYYIMKTLNGTETIVSSLLEENKPDD
jgi:hypothetical protein